MSNRLIGAVVLVLVWGGVVQAQLVDNPQYASWAKQKPGTKVTIMNEVAAQGMMLTQNVTQSLVEVQPEKVIVEITVSADIGGMKREQKQRREIPAKIEAVKANMPPEISGSAKEVGKETIDIAGKKYECTVYEFTGQGAQGSATGKMWATPQIPGAMAKQDMQMTAPIAATMKMTVTAMEQAK